MTLSNGDLDPGELGPVSYIEVEPDLLGRTVLVVHGAVDLPEAGDLRALLTEATTGDCPGVVVDLSDVHFMGSSGLGVLVQAHQELDAAGRSLHIRGASPTIRRAFEITQLDRMLVFEEPA
jgi:anti-sigma B factor antagonist